jgi:hypothetical protein
MRRIALGVLPLLLAVSASSPARAQNASPVPACPEGNLLAGKKPIAWQETRRDLSLLTDEQITPEGSMWDAAPAVIFDTAASTVTWDLGTLTTVRSFAIQADANDTYTIWGSVDGKDYKVFGQIDPVPNHGLRMRTLNVGGMVARYIKFGEGVGDSFYSISEVAAYCQVPSPFPPAMKVVDAPAAAVPPKKLLDYWDNDASAHWELALALLGILFIWWERKLADQRKAGFKPTIPADAGLLRRMQFRMRQYLARSKVRNILVGVMGVLAFLTYFNFGSFHFPNFIHGWDTFHYYIGSKYFKELSYDRLYECVAIADSEEPGLRRRVELRKITNLRTNLVETTADILAHPERCKSHFTPERWESLKHDLRYFRTLENARRWDDAQTDHGYNGTPVWNIMGTILSNLAPASRAQILVLDSVDCILVVFLSLMIWWAFGWRTLTIALIAFSTNFPSRWYWTGGSLLRWDWLFWMGASICLAKKERYFYAGMCLSYSTLLRIFPGFLFVAPLLAFGYHFWKTRELERRFLRFFMGAAVAVAILVPVSVVTAGGVDAYPAFIRNTLKHQGTPLTNYMGLRTVVNYRPSEVGRLMRNDSLVDPWSRWKDARLKSFREAKPLYFGIIACYLVLMGLAVRKSHPWEAIALSSTFIAFGVELTCYYYAFVIVTGVLYAKNESAGKWLLAATAFTQFIGWAPIQGIPDWLAKILPASVRNAPALKNFGMPTGLDEQYTWMSLATLFCFVMIAWDMMVAKQAELAPAKAQPDIKPADAADAEASSNEDDEDEDDDEKGAKEAKTEQPVWRERLERRVSGGKRRKRR